MNSGLDFYNVRALSSMHNEEDMGTSMSAVKDIMNRSLEDHTNYVGGGLLMEESKEEEIHHH